MLRARDNLTQKQAGQLVGVTADTWASWENQKHSQMSKKLLKLKKHLMSLMMTLNFYQKSRFKRDNTYQTRKEKGWNFMK